MRFMLETSARLLRVLSLLQTRRSWPGPELAERLEVDARTVRRDIDRLRSLGYPVRSTPGAAGGYQLEAGVHMPPLLLEDDEAVAVAVSLRTAAGGTVAGVEEAAVRALAKLEHTLPARLRPRVRAFESVTMAVGSAPAVAADVLAAAAGACRDTERLRFEYQDRGGQDTTRTTEPLQLVCTGRRWYLLAWDVDRQDWRTFRVDRVGRVLSVGPRFTPRQPPEGAAAYVSRAISSEPYRYQARFILHAPLEIMARQISPAAGVLTRLDTTHCQLEAGAESLNSLALLAIMLGVDFVVLEPPELARHLEHLSARLTAAAGTKHLSAEPESRSWPAGHQAGSDRLGFRP